MTEKKDTGDVITEEELARLRACTTREEWQEVYKDIVVIRCGVRPSDWMSRVVKSGLAAEVSRNFTSVEG